MLRFLFKHNLSKIKFAKSGVLVWYFYFGELAQLGERLPCTQEVSGSIPLFSTILSNLHLKKKLTYF